MRFHIKDGGCQEECGRNLEDIWIDVDDWIEIVREGVLASLVAVAWWPSHLGYSQNHHLRGCPTVLGCEIGGNISDAGLTEKWKDVF